VPFAGIGFDWLGIKAGKSGFAREIGRDRSVLPRRLKPKEDFKRIR
jgi:hypothetical protein